MISFGSKPNRNQSTGEHKRKPARAQHNRAMFGVRRMQERARNAACVSSAIR